MKNSKLFLKSCLFISFIAISLGISCTDVRNTSSIKPKPNIVWIMLEDWGTQLSCYGEPGIETPYIDKFAEEAIRYTKCFSTSPVCSPSRSAMMTGYYQNYIGAEQHRTAAKFGFEKKPLPNGIKPMTQLLAENGYFTCLMLDKKTDLNFLYEGALFQGTDWKQRDKNQPFFAQITFQKTHRPWQRDSIDPIDITEVRLPPYYPQTDLARRDWANGLEAMQITDREVNKVLDRLKKEGLYENTLVIIMGDNGRCMPRGKQFLYDGGIQVPLIVRWPQKIKNNQVSDDLVSTLDITKTILDVAGVKTSIPVHGKNLFGNDVKHREYIFASRDKMDSTYDAMRTIRSKKYKLIHNLMPERPYCQYNKYKEAYYPVLALLNVMNLKGKLNPEQAQFMAASKPEFELYDLMTDPWELHNLAGNPAYDSIQNALLAALNQWRVEIKDKGVSNEYRKGGWSSDYPTRSLEEWEQQLEGFKPWVFREPKSDMKHPYALW